MDDYKQVIYGARPGQIVPIVKEIDIDEAVNDWLKV